MACAVLDYAGVSFPAVVIAPATTHDLLLFTNMSFRSPALMTNIPAVI